MGTGLAEDFTAKRVRKERLHVGRVGGHNQVQQVRGGRVVGDEVGRGFADPKVEDLHVAGTFARGDFPGALGHLVSVVGPGHEDAHSTVEHLVHTVQHQILVM